MKRYLAAAALGAQLLLTATAGAGTRVYVRIAPPAVVRETRSGAPSPRHVWIAGYQRWDGHAYVWVPGRWESPPANP